jgi:hypothetical protein
MELQLMMEMLAEITVIQERTMAKLDERNAE